MFEISRVFGILKNAPAAGDVRPVPNCCEVGCLTNSRRVSPPAPVGAVILTEGFGRGAFGRRGIAWHAPAAPSNVKCCPGA